MAQITVLPAGLRTLEGKSHLTHLRREGKIPAIMYGRATPNTPIQLDGKAFEQFLKRHGASGIVELQIGQSIHVADLALPEGVETAQSPDSIVVAATMTAAGRGQEAEAAAEAEPAPAAER